MATREVRATKKPRSSRVGLKPLSSPAPESYWILRDNPASVPGYDSKEYRIVVVTQARRGYLRAGHQSVHVEVVPARFRVEHGMSDKVAHMRYSIPYEEFNVLYRVLEGEEFEDEMAMLLLANV